MAWPTPASPSPTADLLHGVLLVPRLPGRVLAGAIAADWSGLDTASRGLFVALTVLCGYMIWRPFQARRLQQTTSFQHRARRIDHIGFTLIALFDGYVIILALDLGAPAWAVIAIAGIAAGHTALGRLKRQTT